MVYIFAVRDHNKYQLISEFNEPVDDLRDELETFLDDNDVELIAEEMVESHCGFGCKGFVCEEVAEKYDIEHRFVELDAQSRADIGIASEDHDAREAYWLSEIDDVLDDDGSVAFVCGAAHIGSFGSLLEFEGYDYDVVCIIGDE